MLLRSTGAGRSGAGTECLPETIRSIPASSSRRAALYILKVNADISGILDAGAESDDASGTWRGMKSVYGADMPEDWAILLLASPDWDLRS